MGCALSKTQDELATEHSKLQLEEVYVFFPGVRTPKRLDFSKSLRQRLSGRIITRLNSLRSKVVAAAEDTRKSKLSRASGQSTIQGLQQSLENYLPCLLGLLEEESLDSFTEFCWVNEEADIKETVLSNVHYELLSVLHLLGILFLLEANLILTPKSSSEGTRGQVNEECRRAAVEILMKTAQIMEHAVTFVWPRIPEDIRSKLPSDLLDGSLKSLKLQALGQAVEIQLGLAIDNAKATLAVKRRIACEQVQYWQMAYENLHNIPLGIGWGEKHILFLKWKRAAAKAAAYYYHGLVLDEGSNVNKHTTAAACLLAAEAFLKESQQYCREFSMATPVTKQPPVWGAMKCLTDKIPTEAASRTRGVRDVLSGDREKLPDLPDFPLSLEADEYELPPVDEIWSEPQLA